jgi:hypothetical protein
VVFIRGFHKRERYHLTSLPLVALPNAEEEVDGELVETLVLETF